MVSVTQAQSDLRNGFAQMVNTAGTDFTLEHDDGTTETIKAHVVPAAKEDLAIINALGVDAVFLHALASPLLKKFEKLTAPSGREYVIEAVHEVYGNNTLIGQKVIAR